MITPAGFEQLGPVAFALGMQNATDVPAGIRLHQRYIKRDQLIEIPVETPVQQPGRLHAKNSGSGVASAFEFANAICRSSR